MDLYTEKSGNIFRKIFIMLLEMIFIVIAYFILFGRRNPLLLFTSGTLLPGRLILFGFNLVVFLRFLITLFILLKRKIANEELIAVPMAFALYYIGFPLLTVYGGGFHLVSAVIGGALFLLGSLLNTVSESQRHAWKKNPAHKGHLYTGGLFRYSMHINYLGDVLWVAGYACVTTNPFAFLIPVLLFLFFYFYNIPKLDRYLATRYAAEFPAYAARTRKLIPFLL